MKRVISYICAMAILLAIGTVAYADEVNSPSVSFITTTNEDGTYTVTLNWEKTTLQAFEYSVVYDEDKVRVKSAKLTGQFLSPYLGDGKNYSGIAIANDNGGYVALGGVVEAKDPSKIPQYEGAIATIVFEPKKSTVTEDGGVNTAGPDGGDGAQDPDMGDIKVVGGVSEYGSAEEIRQKADSEPMAAFDLVQSAGREPISANAPGIATGLPAEDDAQPQDTPTNVPSETQGAENTEEAVSGSSDAALAEDEVSSESISPEKTPHPTKAAHKTKKEADSFEGFVIVLAVAGCIMVAAVVAIYYKKRKSVDKQGKSLEPEGTDNKDGE